MTTHVPEDATARLLLDGEAISKALSRIAHEIIERNGSDGLERVALVGIQSRGAPLASRLRRLVEERSGVELPVGALDITFHRDDVHVRDGGAPARASAGRARDEHLVPDRGHDGRPRRRRPLHGPDDPRGDRRAARVRRPARVQLAVLVDRGHRELPIRPDYVGKNLPTGRDERIQVELVEIDERDGVFLVAEREDGDGLSSARRRRRAATCSRSRDLERRRRRADPRHAPLARGVARPRGEEAPDAPRAHRRQPLLRVVDADARELRARREAPLGGHDVAPLRRLVGRQGGVAQGHRADARRLRAGRHRRPSSVDRRAAARRAPHRRARRERRRRQAPAPDAGAARPVHDARGARPPRGPARRDRRRRAPLARRPLARAGARLVGARDACSSGRPRSSRAASRRSAARSRRHRRDRATRTSSTSCACSASAWAEAFVPSLREYTALYGITPERVRRARSSCTRGR